MLVSLKLRTSDDPPASASQSAGITGLSHRARPYKIYLHNIYIVLGIDITGNRDMIYKHRRQFSCLYASNTSFKSET